MTVYYLKIWFTALISSLLNRRTVQIAESMCLLLLSSIQVKYRRTTFFKYSKLAPSLDWPNVNLQAKREIPLINIESN
jgi:hypothetical protein